MLIYWNIGSWLLGAGSRHASARNYYFGRSNFHLQTLFAASVSATCARCLWDRTCSWICRGKSVMAPVYGCHSQHDCLLRSSKVHQRRHPSVTSPWCLPLECATGRTTSCVDHWPKTPTAITHIPSKTHISRVVASRINFLSTELPPPTPFPWRAGGCGACVFETPYFAYFTYKMTFKIRKP